MSQIKSAANDNNVENPPAGPVSHEIFQHVSPPEQMSEHIDRGNADAVQEPPAGFQKANFGYERFFCHTYDASPILNVPFTK